LARNWTGSLHYLHFLRNSQKGKAFTKVRGNLGLLNRKKFRDALDFHGRTILQKANLVFHSTRGFILTGTLEVTTKEHLNRQKQGPSNNCLCLNLAQIMALYVNTTLRTSAFYNFSGTSLFLGPLGTLPQGWTDATGFFPRTSFGFLTPSQRISALLNSLLDKLGLLIGGLKGASLVQTGVP